MKTIIKMLFNIFSFCLGGVLSSMLVIHNQNKINDICRLYSSIYKNLEERQYDDVHIRDLTTRKFPLELIALSETCKFMFNFLSLKVEQHFTQSCVKKGNYYIITHIIEGKTYKLMLKPKRGPIDDDYDPFKLGYISICNSEESKKID